jgi:hypothetical protein
MKYISMHHNTLLLNNILMSTVNYISIHYNELLSNYILTFIFGCILMHYYVLFLNDILISNFIYFLLQYNTLLLNDILMFAYEVYPYGAALTSFLCWFNSHWILTLFHSYLVEIYFEKVFNWTNLKSIYSTIDWIGKNEGNELPFLTIKS